MVAKHPFGVARLIQGTELLFGKGLAWVERRRVNHS